MSLFNDLKKASDEIDKDERKSCEWLGQTVYAGELTPKQLDLIQSKCRSNVGGVVVNNPGAMLLWTIRICLQDKEGNRVFRDPGDRQGKLAWLESRSLDELSEVLTKLGISSEESIDELTAEAKKNLKEAQSD